MSALLSSGADAMDNLFEVSFIPPSSWGFSSYDLELLKVRVENFKPPSPKRSVVSIPYKNTTIQKPGSVVELERRLTFTIRIDNNFVIYKLLENLKSKSFNATPSVQTFEPQESLVVTAVAFKDDETKGLMWEFRDVTFLNMSSTEYSHDAQAAPTKLTVDLIYSTYINPFL